MISISFSWSTICYGSNMEQFRSPNFPVITVLSIAVPCVPVSPDPALVVKPHWDPRQLPLTFGIPQVIEVLVGMIFLGSFSPCIFLGDSWEKHLKRLDGIFVVMFRSTEIWRKTTGDSKYFDGTSIYIYITKWGWSVAMIVGVWLHELMTEKITRIMIFFHLEVHGCEIRFI